MKGKKIECIDALERESQNRLVLLFQNELDYRYLGNWEHRDENSNIEEEILRKWLLEKQNYKIEYIDKALNEIDLVINNTSRSLFDKNKEFYNMLRYGINIHTSAGKNSVTIDLRVIVKCCV